MISLLALPHKRQPGGGTPDRRGVTRRHVLVPTSAAAALLLVVALVGRAPVSSWAHTGVSLSAYNAVDASGSNTSVPIRAAAVKTTVSQIKVVNYYPRTHGWTSMWTDWQPGQMNADFAQIHSLGANAVRISTFPSVMGFPTVSAVMAQRLRQMLSLASANHLSVQLTLFDWFGNWAQITRSQQWVESLLGSYSKDPRITMIELANEVDPSNTTFMAWAKALLPTVRRVAPLPLTTLSVTGTLATGPARLAALVKGLRGSPLEAADIHFYALVRDAYQFLSAAKKAAGGLPLFVGEAGLPVPFPGGRESSMGDWTQAQYLDSVFHAARTLGLSYPAPWTLHDFSATVMPGGTMIPDEYHFGLFRSDNTIRPAGNVVTTWFTTGKSSLDVPNGSFTSETPDGVPTWWMSYYAQYGSVVVDKATGHDAVGSVRFSRTGTPAGGVPSIMIEPTLPIVAGQTWSVSGWARGTSATGYSRIGITWFDRKGTYMFNSESVGVPQGTSAWQQLRVSVRVPVGAASMLVGLRSAGNSGTVWFDDIAVSVSG